MNLPMNAYTMFFIAFLLIAGLFGNLSKND